MRTIKFRAKRVDNGEWVYGSGYVKDYFNDNEFIAIVGDPIFQHMDMIRVIYKTVGQFTGLYDKNGKEIYEGDIIVGYGTHNLVVFIEKGHVEVKFNDLGTEATCLLFQKWLIEEDGELIGNIHDNKELLND